MSSTSTDVCIDSDDFIPEWVVISYGGLNFTVLTVLSVFFFVKFQLTDAEFAKKPLYKKLWIAMKQVWNTKKCFLGSVVHIWDQASDIGVIVLFWRLYKVNNGSCYGNAEIHFQWFFAASILAFMAYRVISAVLIARVTVWWRFFTQAMDLDIFWSVYVNYKHKVDEPSNPQRWITSLEATYEASPQAIIQLVYLLKNTGSNALIWISFWVSWLQIVTRTISDDKSVMKDHAKSAAMDKEDRPDAKDVFLVECCNDKIFDTRRGIKCCAGNYLSVAYMIRSLYRFCEIAMRTIVCSLLWMGCGGFTTAIYLTIDFGIIALVTYSTKEAEYLHAMVTIPLSRTSEGWMYGLNIYRWFCNVGWLVMITVDPMDGWSIPPMEERSLLYDNPFQYSIFIIGWILILPHAWLFWITLGFIDDRVKSKDRTVKGLAEGGQWNDLVQLHTFGGRNMANDVLDVVTARGTVSSSRDGTRWKEKDLKYIEAFMKSTAIPTIIDKDSFVRYLAKKAQQSKNSTPDRYVLVETGIFDTGYRPAGVYSLPLHIFPLMSIYATEESDRIGEYLNAYMVETNPTLIQQWLRLFYTPDRVNLNRVVYFLCEVDIDALILFFGSESNIGEVGLDLLSDMCESERMKPRLSAYLKAIHSDARSINQWMDTFSSYNVQVFKYDWFILQLDTALAKQYLDDNMRDNSEYPGLIYFLVYSSDFQEMTDNTARLFGYAITKPWIDFHTRDQIHAGLSYVIEKGYVDKRLLLQLLFRWLDSEPNRELWRQRRENGGLTRLSHPNENGFGILEHCRDEFASVVAHITLSEPMWIVVVRLFTNKLNPDVDRLILIPYFRQCLNEFITALNDGTEISEFANEIFATEWYYLQSICERTGYTSSLEKVRDWFIDRRTTK